MMKKSPRSLSPSGKKSFCGLFIVVTVVLTFLLLLYLNHQISHDRQTQHYSMNQADHKLYSLSSSRQRTVVNPIVHIKSSQNVKFKSHLDPSILPSFADQHREYVFSSLIERSSTNLLELYTTTFLLSHAFLRMPDVKYRSVDPDYRDIWLKAGKNFITTKYFPSGRRDYPYSERFTCRIQHSKTSQPYVVSGDFIPNRGTPSNGANRRVDILRCPLSVPNIESLLGYINKEENLLMEIYQGGTPVISFHIPWKTRMIGFGLEHPQVANHVHPWVGLNLGNNQVALNSSATVNTHQMKAHLCMPCMKKGISRNNLPLLLEYIAHHLNIGFDHISLATVFPFSSPSTGNLISLLRGYIEENRVSISSLADPFTLDEQVPLFQLHGMGFFRIFMVAYQSVLCLYRSKGIYDYMMVLDLDELLLPTYKLDPPGNTLIDLILRHSHLELTTKEKVHRFTEKLSNLPWKAGPGWADKHRHPACYLSITSQVILRSKSVSSSTSSWIGEDFRHGPEINSSHSYITLREMVTNAIVPTQTIYFMAMKSPGACAVDWYWNGCLNESISICLEPSGSAESTATLSDMVHTFDQRVNPDDAQAIHEAVIYHYRYYENMLLASPSALKAKSLYRSLWFGDAKKHLSSRGYDVIMNLPSTEPEPMRSAASDKLLPPNYIEEEWRGADEISKIDVDVESNMVLEWLATSVTNVVSLPRFSADLSELVMSSLIERTAHTDELSITTFMLCHYIVTLQENVNQQVILKIHPKARQVWNKVMANFLKTRYRLPGKRIPEDFFACRVRNVLQSKDGYTVLDNPLLIKGRLVPSAATVDHNANYRAEVLRCSLPLEEATYYLQYAGNQSVFVEVELIKNNKALIKYHIPYESRITGYMSFSTKSIADWQKIYDEQDTKKTPEIKTSHEHHGDEISSISSIGMIHDEQHKVEQVSVHDQVLTNEIYSMSTLTIDPWKARHEKMDKVYLCVPGWRSSPSKDFLAHLFEFVQHHLFMGVQHIFLGVTFAWKSPHMKHMLRVLKPFLDEGRLSIASHTADNLDYRFTLAGTVIRNTPIKVYSVNLCLYFAKGMADYIAVWDVDEFFVPYGKYNGVPDLLDDVDTVERIPYPYTDMRLEQINATYKPSKGMADGHAHPLCYIQLYSSTFYQVHHRMNDAKHERIWFRDNYLPSAILVDELSHKKAIHPTRRSFSLNLHTGGACALPYEYTDCALRTPEMNLKLYNDHGDLQHCYTSMRKLRRTFQRSHDFDEPPQHLVDAKNVDRSYAEIYHVQFFRRYLMVSNQSLPKDHYKNNKYATHYSAKVLDALDSRDLYQPLVLLNDPEYLHSTLKTVQHVITPMESKPLSIPAITVLSSSVIPIDVSTVQIVITILSNHSAVVAKRINFARSSLPMTVIPTKYAGAVKSTAYYTSVNSICRLVDLSFDNLQVRVAGRDATDTRAEIEVADADQGLYLMLFTVPKSSAEGVVMTVSALGRATGCGEPLEFDVFANINNTFSQGYNEDAKDWGIFSIICDSKIESATNPAGYELLSSAVDLEVNRFSTSLISEYLVHHYLLGVKHITLPIHAVHSSTIFNRLAVIFRHFISSGKLTLIPILHNNYHIPDHGLVQQIIQSLVKHCARARKNNQLLHWGYNYLYIPNIVPDPYPSAQSSSFLFSSEESSIQALPLSLSEYMDNIVVHGSNQYKLYQGEIYLSSTHGEGFQLNNSVFHLNGDSSMRNATGAVHSSGVLYELWSLDLYQIDCLRPSSPTSQEYRVCQHLAKKRSPVPEEVNVGEKHDSTWSYNLYHSHYFPVVFAHMMQENLDLFIDSIEESSPEVNPSTRIGDEVFVSYRKAYEANPLIPKITLQKPVKTASSSKPSPERVPLSRRSGVMKVLPGQSIPSKSITGKQPQNKVPFVARIQHLPK